MSPSLGQRYRTISKKVWLIVKPSFNKMFNFIVGNKTVLSLSGLNR
jgi:hypothetical protein